MQTKMIESFTQRFALLRWESKLFHFNWNMCEFRPRYVVFRISHGSYAPTLIKTRSQSKVTSGLNFAKWWGILN